MDSPGKICKIKILEERLIEKVSSLRRIDSVFPDNDAKMLSHNLYFDRRERQMKTNWRNERLSYHYHLNRLSLSISGGRPRGDVPGERGF